MNDKKRQIGITAEIVVLILACIILFAGITSYIGYNIFSKAMKTQIETTIRNTCRIARDCVNGDSFGEYLESKGESGSSARALELLQKVCDDIEFNYIYIIRPDFDADKVVNSISVHGSMYPELETYDVGAITDITAEDYEIAYRNIMYGKSDIEYVYRINMSYSDRYKDHITGLVPITDSKGEIVGIMCAEVTFAWYQEALYNYRMGFIKWLVIAIIAIIIICTLLLRYRVVIPFIKITKETDRFAHCNTVSEHKLSERVNRKNELGLLAEAIDMMEAQTTNYIENITKMTSERERIGAELDIATRIQFAVLPHNFPAFPERKEFELFATMEPAKEVGGDFYDFFLIDDDHLAIVIADVSGKGIPAALFMMVSKIMIENYATLSLDPTEILEQVNNSLCTNNEVDMFVTVWLGILEISTGKLRTSNGGHENPAIMRAGEKFELYREKHSFILGGMEGISYKPVEYKLEPGDVLFVYTDGVPEATNSQNELFGADRMLNALNNSKNVNNLQEFIGEVRTSVDEFVGEAPQFDDLTMLALKYNGSV
ncbi:MAG: SpoIIE family protein phosphatase [Lachnospiraceae bacterium]|nr:SpoIIE family protein phosphatase [Candidatus Colinaster scatohippi]